jgi:uncharacterized protein (DUF1684 family)
MFNRLTYLFALALAVGTVACGRTEPEIDLAAYEAEVMDWRAGRLERLMAPTGYLTQIGLYLLEDGSYSMGSAAGSDFLLPATAAETVGELQVSGGEVRMHVAEGVTVTQDGAPVTDILMPPDTSGELVLLSHGSIAWSVIERGGKLAVRIRDFEHPWVESFGPLPYYDIDPALRVTAKLVPYDEPRTVTVNTVIEGFQQYPVSPGVAVFEIAGQPYELEPTISGERLFFVFGDETNRDETYGAGRFVYTAQPGEDGTMILDFNQSYSPPCAFNDFATCPVASPHNRLPIRIEAGEKFDPALHYSPGATH